MRLSRLALIFVGSALALGGCRASADDDAAFGARVRAYLLAHPEVLQETMVRLQQKQDAAAIDLNRQALERDPRDFVANPAGKVTVTEFYDYRCPHCISVAPAVLGLIRDDPNIRFVFKEMPIFGDLSDRAAAGAIAVKAAGGDNLGYYKSVMETRPLDDAALDRILKTYGVDPKKLAQPEVKAAAEDQLASVHNLAIALGVEGTPAFVVGDTLIPGEKLDDLRAAIAQAKKKAGL